MHQLKNPVLDAGSRPPARTDSSSLVKNPSRRAAICDSLFDIANQLGGQEMRGRFHGGLFSYISPERRVPANHPLRQIRVLVRDVLKELTP